MPYKIIDEDNGRGMYVSFSGLVTGREFIEQVHTAFELDPQHHLRWKLNDFLIVDKLDISNKELRQIADMGRMQVRYYPMFLSANVVKGAFMQSASMIMSVHADQIEGLQIETFGTVDDARGWIGSNLDGQ